MNRPQVTVIVPVYNHEEYIRSCIRSIWEQSYGAENIQLIVVEDCSPDGSRDVVIEEHEQLGFDLILNETNRGIIHNINLALKKATGKYVCITGSDDIWDLKKLDIQVEYMEAHPEVGACSGNQMKIDSKGEQLGAEFQKKLPHATYEFNDVFLRRFFFSTPLAMMRRSALEVVGEYPTNLKVEDFYMWLKLTSNGFQMAHLESVLGKYRVHKGNTNAKAILIYEEVYAILQEYRSHPLYKQAAKRLVIVYFPKIALLSRKRAWKLLPKAVSNTRFFYRGLYYLISPGVQRRKAHALEG
jgi:alpha-1,3-rhamnosyltransferase